MDDATSNDGFGCAWFKPAHQVRRRCEAQRAEAIQNLFAVKLDCFASLAMTDANGSHSASPGAIHARVNFEIFSRFHHDPLSFGCLLRLRAMAEGQLKADHDEVSFRLRLQRDRGVTATLL
jgi:hypothetical protein